MGVDTARAGEAQASTYLLEMAATWRIQTNERRGWDHLDELVDGQLRVGQLWTLLCRHRVVMLTMCKYLRTHLCPRRRNT